MIKSRIAAALLCGVIAVSTAVCAAAEPVYTAAVAQEQGATVYAWNGKTALKAGRSYAITKDVTISKKVTIPKGTTLTVRNGAKLWISTNGTLVNKGTLTVAKGGTLAVSGKLNVGEPEAAGTLNVSGKMNFGTKSAVTVYGKVSVKSTGVVSKKPKTIYVGDTAKVTITGKDANGAFTNAVSQRDLRVAVGKYYTTAISKADLYGAITAAYPKAYTDKLNSELSAAGTTLKDFCADYGKVLAGVEDADSYYGSEDYTWELSINKLVATSALTAGQKAAAELISGTAGYKAYSLSGVISAVYDGTADAQEEISMKVILSGGKWYMLG